MIMKNDAKFKRNWLVILKLARHFTNFDPSILYLKVSKIFILMCSFWAMYLLFELKKVLRSYLSWHWRGIQNLERNRFVVSKLTYGIWQTLTWALESLENCHFNGLLLRKIYIFWAKKVQTSYLSWHWRVMQNLKRNWLVVWKMAWGILQLRWDPFAQIRKCTSSKFTEELCVMTMKSDTKIDEEFPCPCNIDMRYLTNFNPSTRKSKKFVSFGFFLLKYIIFEL